MGFWDKVEKALDYVTEKTADGADRAVGHVVDDLDSTTRGKGGSSIWGMADGKKEKAGDSFSWGTPNTEKDSQEKKDEGFSWW